jgi:hypothetical protein
MPTKAPDEPRKDPGRSPGGVKAARCLHGTLGPPDVLAHAQHTDDGAVVTAARRRVQQDLAALAAFGEKRQLEVRHILPWSAQKTATDVTATSVTVS